MTKEMLSKSGGTAVVGYAQFKNIGSMMPMKYDETVTKRYGVELIVGSPVVATIVAINQRAGRRQRFR